MYNENMCRICLTERNDEFENLFDENFDKEKLTYLGKLYVMLFGLQISADALEPQYICNYCTLQLKLFHKFKNKALESHKKFSEQAFKLSSDEEVEALVKPEFTEDTIKVEILSNEDSSDNHHVANEQFEEVQYLDDETFLDAYEEYDEKEDYVSSQRDSNYGDEEEDDKEDDMNSNIGDMEFEELNQNIKIENTAMLTCKDCHESFTKKSQLSSHRKRMHPRTRLKCTLCPKVFLSKETMDVHVKVHNGLPAYECEECFKTFKQKGHYIYHMMGHKNERNVQCHLCGKGFINNSDLRIHLRVHNDERRYECDVCGKKFRANTHMTNHRYSHFEKQLECSLCLHKYSSPNTLKTHIRSVHKGECPYTCEICNKKFKRKHHLKAHGKTHATAAFLRKIDEENK